MGRHIKVDLALAYTDAHYTRTLIDDGAVVVRQGDAVGPLPHVVSPWNVTGSVEYTVAFPHDAIAVLRAEDIFRSRNPGPFTNGNPGFCCSGAWPDPSTNAATLRRSNYDVALVVNNVLDAQPTLLHTFEGAEIFPFLATTFRPRTIGLSFSWRY
jgi:iron complex outermembrane recepter protein